MASPQSFGRKVARGIARGVVRFFYSSVEVSGRERITGAGPILFVANHANSLIDPVIVGLTAKRPVHFLSKTPLFEIPVFGAILRAVGMLPAYRGSDGRSQVSGNLEMLAAAAALLARGESVGVFPEGKSHDALKVEKVRSGAARIAVQAVQEGAQNLMIVPLGINYQRKEQFRSSIWVRVGRPILLGEWQQQIKDNDRAAQRALTAEIDGRLKDVVIHLDDEKWEPFLSDLEALVPPPGEMKRTPISALQQRKRLADAMNYFLTTDKLRAEMIATDIEAHRKRLADAGLTVQSDLFRVRYTRLFLRQAWDFIRLVLGFVPALLGTLHNWIPFLIVRAAAARIPGPNRSVIALKRLGLGFPIYGTWYVIIWWMLGGYFLPWVATVWSLLMLAAGTFALRYWPRGKVAAELWWSELRMLLQNEKLPALRESHFQLRQRLAQLADEYRTVQPREAPLPTRPWSWYVKKAAAWSAAVLVAIALGLWGWAKARQHQPSLLQQQALELKEISASTLVNMLAEDEKSLTDILEGLRALEEKALRVQSELISGKRSFYTQSDNDAIRQLLFSYLTYRTELLRSIWKYQNHAQVSDERLQLRTFLLELTAASALYESSFKLVTRFAPSEAAVRKLNEGEPLWEIPPRLYDTIRANLATRQNRELLKGAWRTYDSSKAQFIKFGLASASPHNLFHQIIQQSRKTTANMDRLAETWNALSPFEDAQKLRKAATYRGQSLISTWVGDTRIRQPRQGKPLIQPGQLDEFRRQLKPGDILVERQNWYLSRAFMPGYWAHAAIYVGTTNDLIKMGLDKDPRVQKFWKEFAARDALGHEHVILEAVPRGVRMTTLEHCIGVADSAAALRPRISPDRLPEVIAQAFIHLGKPYDFEFDFFSTDKLVCTELVYRCCGREIQFSLVDVLGRKTLPPTEMVRKFAKERRQPRADLQFVAFLDGEESKGKASFKGEEVFAETVNRPSMTWLQKQR